MRVVGGKFKSRILKEFNIANIRPTADNVKESLFNIIGDRVLDCSFLDLFCGTGACGIEAISRGAKKVVFNDNSRDSLSLTRDNLTMLNVPKDVFILSQKDGQTYLMSSNEKFDIVFIDPPYKNEFLSNVVNLSEKVIKDSGIIICENEKPFTFDTPNLIKYDERKYGRVYLSFFKKSIPKDETCLFAGSFDPITSGHLEVIKEGLKRYKKVVVAIGINSEKTPTFNVEQRLELINLAINNERVIIDNYNCYTVDYMKEKGIKVALRGIRDDKDKKYEKKIQNFNQSLYQEYIPEYIYINEQFKNISSTLVKERLKKGKEILDLVPQSVNAKIQEFYKKTTE